MRPNERNTIKEREATIKNFEFMRNMAELKALSNTSLERELNDKEFNRMKELMELIK